MTKMTKTLTEVEKMRTLEEKLKREIMQAKNVHFVMLGGVMEANETPALPPRSSGVVIAKTAR